ncbi:Similar to Beta integral membrane protein (gb/U43629) [Arabidopsis thaliana]|nr:Similar to Beta integral membrane protein (gb/U43629) [Arabidopsis thaliana]
MESGSMKTPLVNNQEEARSSSSITCGLLLSTSVAVTGSFVYGCACSSWISTNMPQIGIFIFLIKICFEFVDVNLWPNFVHYHNLKMSYSSPAQSKIMEELGLSVADYSFFTSVMTLGGMITAAFSGKIAAVIGRRQTMWIADVFCIFGWLAVAFAHYFLIKLTFHLLWFIFKDKMLLNIGRGFLGFGVGLISYVVPVYIAEITPKAFRGGFSFSNQLLQSFGISLMFFTGNFFHWRTLALLSAIPCGIQMICLFFIPESPRWLVIHTLKAMYGRERELEVTLKRLRGENGDILEEAAEIRIGLGLMLLQQFCGSSAISAYAARIFDTAGTAIYYCHVCRRPMWTPTTFDELFYRSVHMFIFNWPLLLSSGLVILTILFFGYVLSFGIGLGGLPWVIMSEVFPVNVKITAGSLVTVSNWFFSWIIIFSFNFMMQWSAFEYYTSNTKMLYFDRTYFIFAGVSLMSFVFVWTLVPETKGRTLEDIQQSLGQLS